MNKKQRILIRQFNERTVKKLKLNLKDGVRLDRDGFILGGAIKRPKSGRRRREVER